MRYLGSEFLGHATAADLLTHFKDGIFNHITQLDPKQLLQVSMDGPSVKFYTDLARERKNTGTPQTSEHR